MISTIREIAWKKQRVWFRTMCRVPGSSQNWGLPGGTMGSALPEGSRESLQQNGSCWPGAEHGQYFCETGKITPGWVAGDMNCDMSLSLWRASAEALQLILNTDCQKRMKESIGEAMRSRKQEKKPGARVWQVPSVLLKPVSIASVSQNHPVNSSCALHRISVCKKFVFSGLWQMKKRQD